VIEIASVGVAAKELHPSAYDRIRNYAVETTTDTLSNAWANTANGVSDAIGAPHPGHATVVGDVRPGIQSGVGIGFDVGVQLLLMAILN
jgi:hypothetical protein